MTTHSPSIAVWTRLWAEKNGLECLFSETTESTNLNAKMDIDNKDRSPMAPVLYLAAHQTAGRGRGSNTWTDTSGNCLLSSWSFHMNKAPQPVLAPLVGLAVYNALKKVWPDLKWALKAPNDIYLGDKKIAGILIETVDAGSARRTIVGLGLNVFATPPGVPTATNLAEGLGSTELSVAAWEKFLQAMLLGLVQAMPKGQAGEINSADAAALTSALNLYPGLKAKIDKVGKNGELHTKDGVINWTTL